MNPPRWLLLIILPASILALGTLAASIASTGPTYTFTTINQLDDPSAAGTFAYGINNLGTVVGTYFDGGAYHGFVVTPSGTYTNVDVPNSASTWITAINNKGELAGFYEDGSANYVGFIASKK